MAAPYLSRSELIYAPTGINFANIPVRGATDSQQASAQSLLIEDATSWCDDKLQYGFNPSIGFALSATQVVETIPLTLSGGRRARFADGRFTIFTSYLPVISVSLVEYSPDGQVWTAVDWTVMIMGRQTLYIVPGAQGSWSSSGWGGWPCAGFMRLTYLAGFANSTLTADASVGATSLSVADRCGWVASQSFNLYEGPGSNETVVIASSYTVASGAGVLPLTAGTRYAHTSGIAASSMPPGGRRACLEKVIDFIRERGMDAVTQGSAGRGKPTGPNQRYKTGGNGDKALEYLQPFMRTV